MMNNATKCCCRAYGCKKRVYVGTDAGTVQLWITDPDAESLVYLDANSTIKLIRELRDALSNLADE
jgi:hypothetical protein